MTSRGEASSSRLERSDSPKRMRCGGEIGTRLSPFQYPPPPPPLPTPPFHFSLESKSTYRVQLKHIKRYQCTEDQEEEGKEEDSLSELTRDNIICLCQTDRLAVVDLRTDQGYDYRHHENSMLFVVDHAHTMQHDIKRKTKDDMCMRKKKEEEEDKKEAKNENNHQKQQQEEDEVVEKKEDWSISDEEWKRL